MTKADILRSLQDLPDDATVEDAMERLRLLAKIERGLAQAKSGRALSDQAVRRRMAKWLK